MKTVVAIGESLIDMVSSQPGALSDAARFEMAPGGAPANVAACIGRLGGRAAFVGIRGNDGFGDALLNTLADCQVDTTYFKATDEAKTALAFVSLTMDGDRSFLFYRDPSADMLLRPEDIPLAFLESCGIIHIGSVSLSSHPSREAILFTAKEAKKRGVFVSYDPNWRPALWERPDEGREVIAKVYPYCDLIKVNREEQRLLAHTDIPEQGAEFFHRQGIPLVIITLDKDGCYYSYRSSPTLRTPGPGPQTVSLLQYAGDPQMMVPRFGRTPSVGHEDEGAAPVAARSVSGYIPGIPVRPVDTTGAGDAFIGAFLYSLSQADANAPSVCEEVDLVGGKGASSGVLAHHAADLESWVRFSVLTSALVTLKKGAIPAMPTRAEIEAFQAQQAKG